MQAKLPGRDAVSNKEKKDHGKNCFSGFYILRDRRRHFFFLNSTISVNFPSGNLPVNLFPRIESHLLVIMGHFAPAVVPVMVTSILFTTIAFIIVTLRLYTRVIMIKNPGADDWIMLAAMIASIGFLATIFERKQALV